MLTSRWVILKLPSLHGVGWCFGEDGVKSELISTSHKGHSGKRIQWARNRSGHGAEGKWPNMRMISEICWVGRYKQWIKEDDQDLSNQVHGDVLEDSLHWKQSVCVCVKWRNKKFQSRWSEAKAMNKVIIKFQWLWQEKDPHFLSENNPVVEGWWLGNWKSKDTHFSRYLNVSNGQGISWWTSLGQGCF